MLDCIVLGPAAGVTMYVIVLYWGFYLYCMILYCAAIGARSPAKPGGLPIQYNAIQSQARANGNTIQCNIWARRKKPPLRGAIQYKLVLPESDHRLGFIPA